MEEKKEKTCCFTGHRVIPREEIGRLQFALQSQISALAEKGITIFYCGVTLGFDTLAADAVVFVSSRYSSGCMQKRNRYMADRSCVCIAYLLPQQQRGGTKYTVAYCEKKNLPVVNLADMQ